MSIALTAYRAATALAEPFAGRVLRLRAAEGKEDRARMGERLGRASIARPAGPLVWLHGASVGESLSHLPLIERLAAERPDVAVLATSGTVTSAELLAKRLPEGAIHQYVPLDTPGAARRFLDHWRPGLAVLVESELWPNLILGAEARGAKLALVSARITEGSAKGWARAPAAARQVLGAFDLILPQDPKSAARLRALGGRVDGYANLKTLGAPLAVDRAEVARLKTAAGGREIVLAASTHEHEEALIASAVEMTRCAPLLVIVPRHPARGPAIAAQLRASGKAVALRSAGEPLTATTDIYIADTLGELGTFFVLADVVVMGGSFFTGVGGHNPLEPARLGKGVVHGEDIGNWSGVYHDLMGGAVRAETEGQLTEILSRLLRDPAERDRLDALAAEAAGREDGLLDRLWAQLEPLVPAA